MYTQGRNEFSDLDLDLDIDIDIDIDKSLKLHISMNFVARTLKELQNVDLIRMLVLK